MDNALCGAHAAIRVSLGSLYHVPLMGQRMRYDATPFLVASLVVDDASSQMIRLDPS